MGGALRDLALGISTHDLDLASHGEARALAAALARSLGGTLVVLDDETRVYRVVLRRPRGPVRQIDIAQLQGRDIAQDLRRRDFPLDAMAAEALPGGRLGPLLDPRGGLRDAARRVLRVDDPGVFAEDPLRLLRAFRLAARLGLRLAPSTLRAARAHRGKARKPAGERIRAELLSLLAASPSHPWLRLMDKAGLLTALLPELEASRRCARVYYGEGGVLRHALDAVERLDLLLERLDRAFPSLAPGLRAHYAGTGGVAARAPLLRLAVLLHDVAKPATARRVGGRLRFFGHEERGARMAERILKRLRFSNDEMETVALCVRHHLRPGNLAANAVVSDKAVFRFFRDLGPRGVDLLLLCWADHASYLPAARLPSLWRHVHEDPHTFRPQSPRADGDVLKTLRHLQVVCYLLRCYLLRRERVAPKSLLDGHAVMKALGLPPGPAVGGVLEALREAQAEGKVAGRAAALRFVKGLRISPSGNVPEGGPRMDRLSRAY